MRGKNKGCMHVFNETKMPLEQGTRHSWDARKTEQRSNGVLGRLNANQQLVVRKQY